jgi:hypothetical protein
METHHWLMMIVVALFFLYLGSKNPQWIARFGL